MVVLSEDEHVVEGRWTDSDGRVFSEYSGAVLARVYASAGWYINANLEY